MKKPKPIRPILEGTLKALEIDVPLKSYSIFGAWKKIVGDSLAHQTQPRSIRNRILFIDVSHPAWIQQLQFLKATLLEKINAFLGEPHIQDIRFKVGKIPFPPSVSLGEQSWQREEPDEATMKRIDHLLGQIDEGEIRNTLKAVLVKGASLERHRKKSK